MRRSSLRVTLCAALWAVSALVGAGRAQAQTIRFQTTVGAFDMLLNPTNNAGLQPLVDNMLANVAAGVYHRSVVNRAPSGFVLQMGTFLTDSRERDSVPTGGWEGINSFPPVVVDANNDGQVDFNRSGLTNTVGTVSLALSSGNPNSGSSSFFVNLTNNSFLDNQGFVPFATIADMTVINRIMALDKVDLSREVGQNGSLAYTDVPLAPDGGFVVIESATVVSASNFSFVGPLLTAFQVDLGRPLNTPTGSGASSSSADMAVPAPNGSAVSAVATPEPAAGLLVLLAIGMRGRGSRR